MKKLRKILALILAMLMTLLISACGTNGNEEPSQVADPTPGVSQGVVEADPDAFERQTAADSLTVGVMWELGSFDMAQNNNWCARVMVYEGLFYIDQTTSEMHNLLCDTYDFVDDTHLHIKLRDDAYFSDGSPVTSEDALWSWQRMVGTSENNTVSFINFEEFEIINDKEFILAMNAPYAAVINVLAGPTFYITSKNMENYTADDYWDKPIGSGPFLVTENVSGSHVSFELNPNYWNSELMPEFSTCTIKLYGDASSMMIDYETGALDGVTNIDGTDVTRVLNGDVKNTSYMLDPQRDVYYIALPEYMEVFDDIRVREALACAIDYDAVAAAALGVMGSKATGPLGDGVMYQKTYDGVRYDPDYARDLLAQAGVTDLELTVYYEATSIYTTMITMVQAYWDEIGVTLNMESGDMSTIREYLINCATDICIYNNGGNYCLDPNQNLSFNAANSMNGCIRLTDEELNEYLSTGASSYDSAVREEAYGKAQDWMVASYRQLYLANSYQMNVYRPYIEKFVGGTYRTTYFRFVDFAD